MGIGTGTAAIIGGVASAGAGVAGSAMQASAAQDAASQQAAAAQQAQQLMQQNAQQALGYQTPYLNLGQGGASLLANMMGLQGGGAGQVLDWQGNPTTELNAVGLNASGMGLQEGQNISSGGNIYTVKNGQLIYNMNYQGPVTPASDTQTQQINQQRSQISQQIQAGQQATAQNIPGVTGALLTPWTQQFQAPTAAEAAATPGYQFQLQQGLNAIQGSAAAKGNVLSPGTMQALNNYAQGVASTNYQQTYNNAFQNYLQNYNQFQQNQQNAYSRLMGITGVGQAAAGTSAGILSGTSQQQAQMLQNQAAAQASGTVGSANAMAGGLGQIGSTVSGLGTMYAMNQPSSYSYSPAAWTVPASTGVSSAQLGSAVAPNLNLGTANLSTLGSIPGWYT